MEKITHKLAQLFNPQCQSTSFLDTNQDVFYAFPLTIVVQPWLGRHQVYGVFILPNEHQLNYPILLTVKQAGQYRKEAYMVKVNVDRDYPVPSDHYVLRVHLRTRVAVFMLVRGLSSELRNALNWKISYTLKNCSQRTYQDLPSGK